MACVKRQNVSQIVFLALNTLEVMVLSQGLTVNLTKDYFFFSVGMFNYMKPNAQMSVKNW